MKLNVKALVVLLVYSGVIGLMIHDFIMLVMGYQYTWLGLFTMIAAIMVGCECENYLSERLRRKQHGTKKNVR